MGFRKLFLGALIYLTLMHTAIASVQGDVFKTIFDKLSGNYFIEKDDLWFLELDRGNNTVRLLSWNVAKYLQPIAYALLTPKITFYKNERYDSMSTAELDKMTAIEGLEVRVWDHGKYLEWLIRAPNLIAKIRENIASETGSTNKRITQFGIGFVTEETWTTGSISMIEDINILKNIYNRNRSLFCHLFKKLLNKDSLKRKGHALCKEGLTSESVEEIQFAHEEKETK